MKFEAFCRLGLGLIIGGALTIVTGCSTAGWGPTLPDNGAPVSSQQGAPRFVQTTGMRLTQKEEDVKPPSWIRVQDCAIVAVSSPTRYACPDGKVYTGSELYGARSSNSTP
jgi:hypothetical protein